MNNERSLHDARLDRAIDRAVREIMQVDPPPGLRRRVLSRLDAPGSPRTFPAMRYAFAAKAFAAAAVVVTVVSFALVPSQVEPPAPPKPPAPTIASGVPPIDLEAVLSTPTAASRSIPTNSALVSTERIAMPRVTNIFGSQPAGVTAATVREPAAARVTTETLAPLRIVPLSARPIVIESLVLPALLK